MKALSYRDPWGWLVALGIKPVDNRVWGTSFTGRIYIHVSKTFDYDGFNFICVHPELSKQIPDIERFAYIAVGQPNAGKIIGEVDVVGCMKKWIDYGGEYQQITSDMGDQQRELEILTKETPEYFSPWFFGPFGLIHRNPELYKTPVPCRGKVFPHFFDVPPEVEADIRQMKFESDGGQVDYDNDCSPD